MQRVIQKIEIFCLLKLNETDRNFNILNEASRIPTILIGNLFPTMSISGQKMFYIF